MVPDWVKKHLHWIFLAFYCLPVVVLVVGSFLSSWFYDTIVFEYYWGPIANDAGATTQSQSSYNIVNTLTYGYLTVFGALFGYRILVNLMIKTKTKPDTGFFLAITPLIITGAVFRALEDGEIFRRPFQYLFITPIIYLMIYTVAILLAIYSLQVVLLYKNRRDGMCPNKGLMKLFARVPAYLYIVFPFFIMNGFYAWIYFFQTDWYSYLIDPAIPLIITVIFLGALFIFQKDSGRYLKFSNVMIFYASFIMVVGLLIMLQWPNNQVWYDHYTSLNVFDGTNFEEYPIVFGLAALATTILCGSAFLLKKKFKALEAFVLGPNILLIFGQYLDAAATYRAIDFHGYLEKHVLPEFMIEKLGTALVMFPAKTIVLIAVIGLMDIYYVKDIPKEGEERENWIMMFTLIKVAVLMVGLAPGLRDIFRLAMGI